MNKNDIRTYSEKQLRQFFINKEIEPFRASQVYEWLWNKGVPSFDAMTNLSKSFRDFLNQNFIITYTQVNRVQRSIDGTIKSAIKLHDGLMVESVLIPTANRTTACISSQVGCSLDCKFCATATLKRQRNLSSGEIFDQVKLIDEQSRIYYGKPLKNIVFMGMGEPLMNYVNMMSAIDKITSKKGLDFSPSKITVSTSGIPKMIKKISDDNPKFKLAVSLHSAIETIRNSIMPFSKSFSLIDLRDAITYWYSKTKSKVTYEYVVWQGVNDSEKDIAALIKFCKYVPCKVNLIEYNAVDKSSFCKASQESVDRYIKALESHHFVVKVRHSRGEDIDAACGQLVNKIEA